MIKIDRSSKQAIFRIKNLNKLSKAGREHAAYVSGRGLVAATSTAILEKPKSGKVYVRRDKLGRRRRHVASKPNETHANQSGAMRRSLSFKVSSHDLEFGYGVSKNDAPDYAGFVNDGTSKMDARPGLEIAIKGQRRNMQNNFEREIGKRLGRKL